MHAYLIILEINPVNLDKVYASLPLHCTLVHWFWADVSVAELTERLRKVVHDTQPIRLCSGNEETFTGVTKSGTIPVKVNKIDKTSELEKLHAVVCDELDKMQVRYSAPQYVRDGFQPHVTHQGDDAFPKGSVHASSAIYLVEADGPEYGNDRSIRSRIDLSTRLKAPRS